MGERRFRPRHLGIGAGIALAALGAVWAAGFRGFMPLDQSIVWDAAWRLGGGQAPFADFLMPNGVVPALIQAALFAAFGVSWTSYVLHAALANALSAVLVFALLARVFGRCGPAALYALAAAAMFYPPMGTPYMDHHAVLFSALLIVLAAWDGMRPRPVAWVWLVLPPVAALALLSKQTPSLWALLWAGAMLVLPAWRRGHAPPASIAALALGAVAALAGSWALLAWSGATLEDARLSLIGLPGEIGRERLSWSWIAPRLGDLAKPGLLVVVAALALCWRGLRRSDADLVLLAAATGLIVIAALHILLTDNSPWFALGMLPLAAGLAHALAERRLAAQAGLRRHLGWMIGLVTAAQATALLVDTVRTRAANELRRADWAAAARGESIDRRLAGLAWVLPPAVARDAGGETTGGAYHALLQHLRARKGGFVLIGDATVLYALAGRPSAFPALWFHPGLTYPRVDHPARPAFDVKLVRALERHDVRMIVVDGNRTWAGARAAEFGPIAACLARATETTTIGRFRIVAVPAGCRGG